jgi:hypothetical protein
LVGISFSERLRIDKDDLGTKADQCWSVLQ